MNKLAAISQLRPRIISQGLIDLEKMSERVSKNTTYNTEEIYSILRLDTKGIIAALQAGETVKIDGLLTLTANMKVGGEVDLVIRVDRGAIAALNNPQLWTSDKVANRANMTRTADELIALHNENNPEDPVVEETTA